ncbi:DUF3592 domain-containing protein [uncultured Cohaesibacter sp.]|uniref:DUF3592 domain-containing protein n=1 Tax=uncultured Cohaesibacter sp. TaxID=1002546 RepID=UPI0029C7B1DB|nr:DUF3592 domain-containing protein [uncultured Cohaesibacter sp.]
MRYQPAYIYPGSQKVNRIPVEEPASWQFPSFKFHAHQHSSVRLARFLMIVVGMLLLIVGMAHYFTAYTAKSWDQVSATVTRAEVVRTKMDGGAPVFSAKIEYQYVKDGQTFTGTRVSLRPIRSQSPGEVKRMIAGYEVGRTILAHVNQHKPQKAYLNTHPDLYLYALILPGLLLMALSLAIGQAIYMHKVQQHRKAWRFGEFQAPRPSTA